MCALLAHAPLQGPIASIADYPLYAPTTVTLSDSSSTNLTMVYYGGPASGLEHTTAAVPGSVLGRYADVPGGIPAAVAHGQTLLLSPHPEAVAGVQLECAPPLPPGCSECGDERWGSFRPGLEGLSLSAPPAVTSAQQLQNWRWLAETINEFLGTSWTVPTQL